MAKRKKDKQRSTNHYITKLETGRFSLVMYLCITKMPLTTHNTNKSITKSDLKLEFCSIIMTIMTHQETVMLDVHLSSFLCCTTFILLMFVCILCPMLSVSLDCPFGFL